MDGVLWSGTAAGGTDVKPCPNGARGKSKKMPFKFYMYALSLHSKLAHTHSKKNGFTFTRLLYGTSILR